jgi:hypothetical protein
MARCNKEGQFMGIILTMEYTNSRGDKYDIFICHTPLGKHSLARGSRGEFKGIMGQARERKQHGS